MKILVINGECIQTNTSANLCHLAYIRGLVACGHEVTLLSADGRDYTLDPSLVIPPEVKHHTYYGVSLYEKLSLRKKTATTTSTGTSNPSNANETTHVNLIQRAKSWILSLYGVHGIYATFVRKAQQFRSDIEYDYILSISTPVTSHLIAHNLLRTNHIQGKHWIQIWEDPWHSDVYGFNGADRIRKEEQRLLSFADKVCYVSPLTLKNQQEKYPESAHKMFWQPLPFYYQSDICEGTNFDKNRYGYFGDYAPAARNLAPFYEAAKETGIEVNICGRPNTLFASTPTIHIHPRLPLSELKPIEDRTNVLIFLCNRQGGQIPGKIYQYSATNKTILFIMDGTPDEQEVLRNFFGKHNRYVFCQNTKDDIVKAIEKIESGDLGSVHNQPLDDFNPTITINNILKAGS